MIECVQCGNCCPDTCPEKIKDAETGKTVCKKHPSIVGSETRGLFCDLPPQYFYQNMFACLAYYSPSLFPNLKTETSPNGQVVIVPQGPIDGGK